MLSLEKQNELREQYRALNSGWRPATEVYADLVRQYARPESKILDLGCGRGGLIEQLEHPLENVVGLDPDWQSLAEHRLVPEGFAGAVGLSGRLPFRDASLDLIFASWLLEHLRTPVIDFAEIARVLRPQGVFIFITPNGRHPLTLLNAGLGRFARLQGWLVRRFYGRVEADTFPTYYRANSTHQLEKIGVKSGLHLEQLYYISDPTYLAFTAAVFRFMIWFEKTLSKSRQLHLVGLYRRHPNLQNGTN